MKRPLLPDTTTLLIRARPALRRAGLLFLLAGLAVGGASPALGQVITPIQIVVPSQNVACGAQNVPVLAVSLTGNAGAADTFYFDRIEQGAGTAGPADSPLMKVWYQPVAGPFNLAHDTLVATIPTNGSTWDSTVTGGSLNGALYNFPVTVGAAVYFTVDINNGNCLSTSAGKFFQPDFQQFNGLVLGTYDFPSSGPITSASAQTIVGSSPGSFPLINQPGGFVPPGTTGVTILEIQVGAVSGAMPLSAVTLVNTGTALSGDFSAMRLWDEPASAGPGLDPTQAVYVADMTAITSSQWGASIPAWNFQNGDYLIVTGDVAPGATLNHTLQFSVPINGIQPTGGIALPSSVETNSGIVTIAYPTPTPTNTASDTPTSSATPTPTPTPSVTPTSTHTLTSTATPVATSTSTVTSTPTPAIVTVPLTATPTPDKPLYLDQNFFNPGQKSLGMDVRVDQAGEVKLEVFNLAGEIVRKIADLPESPGNYRFSWDGRNNAGAVVGNSVYFIIIQTPSGNQTRKVIVLK